MCSAEDSGRYNGPATSVSYDAARQSAADKRRYNARRRSRCPAYCFAGTRQLTLVPLPRLASTFNVPPETLARYCII